MRNKLYLKTFTKYSNLYNLGMANPVAEAEKAHVVFLAERVLLDKDLREAYDKGEAVMNPKEYFEHAIFYKCEPF